MVYLFERTGGGSNPPTSPLLKATERGKKLDRL